MASSSFYSRVFWNQCNIVILMSNKIVFLIVDIIVLALQFIGIVCNGFILILFAREKTLRQNSSLRLVLLLAITDFLHAATTIPSVIYLIITWNPIYMDLNPYFVRILSIPVVIQLKINLTLTISIAGERIIVSVLLTALYYPILFRKLSSYSYATLCLLIGFLFGIFDLILEFLLSPLDRNPNCAALGCFVSNEFRYYWGTSNMANRTCAGILIVSLVFMTIPSIGVGFVGMIGFSIFRIVGPFYILSLLCVGACNSFIYVGLNRNTRILAINFINKKNSTSKVNAAASNRVESSD
ncbi:hypothetical protein DICVIV_07880 [Dictyocaulus viviparus]|uniref:G-protein coupled receptors family 1 profile domain-containing protein n=1 Tax=Dictyocaulus viviparus TaxID=29172 RepID=A0A0D8XNE5_DICVI|nr:hypothetical protein DICVIV_07880 [Dictyocaulus viviparus]